MKENGEMTTTMRDRHQEDEHLWYERDEFNARFTQVRFGERKHA